MKSPTMTHRTAANAQVGLSYLFLLGFFAMAACQGLGYLKIDVIGALKDVLMLVMSFWFMRQRVSGDEPNPTQPDPPANGVKT